MSKIINPNEQDSGIVKAITDPMHRRSFFKYVGGAAALSTLVLAGCNNDDDGDDPAQGNTTTGGTGAGPMEVNLGTGDVGILNYAFALEQLEAAFYVQVINTKFAGMTAAETQILTDIRDHEVAHREFFKMAIPAANRIPDLTPDFSAINFNDRTSVLTTARTFEDLGVSAYNGAGKLFTDTGNGLVFLGLAGKIVSVEARHAAAIRSMINPGTAAFAGDDVVTVDKGLDVIRMPAQVLPLAAPFIKNKINASGLPTA